MYLWIPTVLMIHRRANNAQPQEVQEKKKKKPYRNIRNISSVQPMALIIISMLNIPY